MKVKLSSYGAYQHQYHIVWIPKYRRRVLKSGVKTYVRRGIEGITDYYPEVEVIKYNIQLDHVHLIIDIPPKYGVAKIVGKIKQNTSRKIKGGFKWVEKVYRPGVFWSPAYFSSTIGLNEKQIMRYVEYQEKLDCGQYELELF